MKIIKLFKPVLYGAGSLLAAASLYFLGVSKTYIEAPRYLGLFEDSYKNKTLEQISSEAKTWENAEDYIVRHLRFEAKVHNSAEEAHKCGKAYCLEAAKIAEELLAGNNNYECSTVVFARKGKKFSHAIELVKDKETGMYGSLGIHASDCINPAYASKEEVCKKIQRSMLGRCGDYQGDF